MQITAKPIPRQQEEVQDCCTSEQHRDYTVNTEYYDVKMAVKLIHKCRSPWRQAAGPGGRTWQVRSRRACSRCPGDCQAARHWSDWSRRCTAVSADTRRRWRPPARTGDSATLSAAWSTGSRRPAGRRTSANCDTWCSRSTHRHMHSLHQQPVCNLSEAILEKLQSFKKRCKQVGFGRKSVNFQESACFLVQSNPLKWIALGPDYENST